MKFRKLRREAKSFFLSGSIERNEDILDIDDDMPMDNPVSITINSISDYSLGAKRNKLNHNVLWIKAVNETIEENFAHIEKNKFTIFNAKLEIVAKATGYSISAPYIFDEVLKKHVLDFFDGETGQSEYELVQAIPLDLINKHEKIFLLDRLEVFKKYRREGVGHLLMEHILEDNVQTILKPFPIAKSKESNEEQIENIKSFYKSLIKKDNNYYIKIFRTDFDNCEYMLIADSFMVKDE